MDSRKAGPNPKLFGEVVADKEMRVSPERRDSCFLTSLFTWEARVGAASDGVAAPEDEVAFLGAMEVCLVEKRGVAEIKEGLRAMEVQSFKTIKRKMAKEGSFYKKIGHCSQGTARATFQMP